MLLVNVQWPHSMVYEVTATLPPAPPTPTLRWGVLGGSSRIFTNSLAPAFAAAGHSVVAAPSSTQSAHG